MEEIMMTGDFIYNTGADMLDMASSYGSMATPGMEGAGFALAMIAGFGIFAILLPVFLLVYKVIVDISRGKLFEKANQPRWRSLIPGWNIYKTATLANKKIFFIISLALIVFLPFIAALTGVKFLAYLSPLLSVILHCVVMYSLGKVFGRSSLFALGLVICPLIFFPILALSGDSVYQQTPIVPTPQPTPTPTAMPIQTPISQ
jgi:hypothetical protein